MDRQKLNTIIFGTDTPAGKFFDVVLLWTILASIATVVVESMESARLEFGLALRVAEWIFTGLFTLEYLFRIYCAEKRLGYIKSFFGVIDLLAIIPTYLSLILAGSQYLIVIRTVRLLRVFRVLKLMRFLGEADELSRALTHSRHKITVFLMVILTVVVIVGTLMFLIEGPEAGFKNIPVSMYWAIVTLTTVGFGDITPQSSIGQCFSALLMVLGYGIIAVPTGIVTAEMAKTNRNVDDHSPRCSRCPDIKHAVDANYCRRCGAKLLEL